MNGQWAGSCGLSSIASSIRGMPVVAKATPWIGYGCVTDRTTLTLSITRASRGNSSQTSSPGTTEGIDPSSPRTSTGAPGFGSKVSNWLGDPYRYSRMQARARPNPGKAPDGAVVADAFGTL